MSATPSYDELFRQASKEAAELSQQQSADVIALFEDDPVPPTPNGTETSRNGSSATTTEPDGEEPTPTEPERPHAASESLKDGRGKVKALRDSLQEIDKERDPIIRQAALYSLRENLGIRNQREWSFLIGALLQEQEEQPPSDFDSILGLETAAAPLASDLFARGLLTLVASDGGVGKSSLLYRLAEAVSRGETFAGQHATAQGKVRIYQLDESAQDAGVKFRRMGLDPCRDRFEVRWKFSPAELPELRREIEENQLTLVILDSLFRIFGGYGQEITAPETALWLYQLNCIASDTGAAIVMSHHLTKPTAGAKRTRTEVTSYDLFGSSYLFNATGDCWGLYRSPRDGADQDFCIRCLKSRSGIVTTGTTYDLQGSEEDYSWIHAGITGSTESLTDRLKGRELVAEFLLSRGATLTADQIAAALNISRQMVHRHLVRLTTDDRLVKRVPLPSKGGRPAWGYRAVPLTRA